MLIFVVGPPQEIGRPKLKCSEPIKRLTSDGPVGYLAKVETVESNYGSSACPWIVEAAIGQTLTLTLVDFAISKDTDAPSDDRRSSGTMCTMYATIRETGSGLAGTGSTTVCGGHPSKETKLFTSTTNTIQVTVVGSSAAALANIPYFLIKYEGKLFSFNKYINHRNFLRLWVTEVELNFPSATSFPNKQFSILSFYHIP